MNQREILEFHAVQNFITHYNAINEQKLTFIRQCTPPMPDTLCRHAQIELGIEVVHTYGTGEEAAMRLGNRQSSDYLKAVQLARTATPLNVRALNSLEQVLHDKATKQYAFSPTWLLIRNAFVLWSRTDYEEHRQEVLVPQTHPFPQIWFLFDRNSLGEQGIMRLA